MNESRSNLPYRPSESKTRAGRRELVTLVLVVLIAAGIWGFVELADEVGEGETAALDEAILLRMRNPSDRSDPIGPKWFEEVMRDFTALGGQGVLTFVTVAAGGLLILERRWRAVMLVLVAVVGGQLLSLALKSGFDRPRPDLVPYGSQVYNASFPSGHSMMSAVTYLTLGALLARLHRSYATKAYVLGLAVALTVVVGISRVYLGVHWPTDVLAGWTAGGTWALLCWLAAQWLQRRGQVEAEPVQPGEER